RQQIRVTSEPFDGLRSAKRYGRANAYKALSINDNLDEIPGVFVESAVVLPPNGLFFAEGGETATLEVIFRNVLAPVSNAMVEMIFDDAPLSADVTSYQLGALQTDEARMLSMQVRLDDDVLLSEGYIPIVLKITDASYEDYAVVRVPIFLDEAWHTVVDLRYPYTSIDMTDRWTIWLSGNFTENNAPVQDIALRSTDGGDQWMFAFGQDFPSGRGVYCIAGIDDMTALVGTGPPDGIAAIARTSDGGENWSSTSVANLTPFVNWIHMFDAQNGLMQGDPRSNVWGLATTTDGGRSWSAIDTPLSAADTEAGWNNSYDVVGDHVWFGTNSSIIYRSTDRGQTWASQAVPSKNSVDISFRDEMVGVARFSKQGELGTDTLALTTDGGLSWSLISTIAAAGGTVIFEREGKRLWFFQQSNAFVTTDLGQTWSVQPTPMDFDFIRDAVEWNDGFVTSVFAAGIEIFRYNSDFMVLDVSNLPHAVAGTPILHPLYPNPVASSHDGSVTARMHLPSAANVQLAIFDMSGKKVRQALDVTLQAGGHQARVSTAGLPAGNYLLRMITADFSATQKLIVLH
ncbi:MAG: T9SS type A sorting domain-containing protein, partial [Bacteroidetes bacterium]|nr:T9SS type A sorting domain-containing protein [Bacteroidota bacterium]